MITNIQWSLLVGLWARTAWSAAAMVTIYCYLSDMISIYVYVWGKFLLILADILENSSSVAEGWVAGWSHSQNSLTMGQYPLFSRPCYDSSFIWYLSLRLLGELTLNLTYGLIVNTKVTPCSPCQHKSHLMIPLSTQKSPSDPLVSTILTLDPISWIQKHWVVIIPKTHTTLGVRIQVVFSSFMGQAVRFPNSIMATCWFEFPG